jgi:predicted TPR repeat methyltransferase
MRALALKPDYPEAHNNLGSALKDRGKLADAVVSYERALALKPDFAEVHNNLGSALEAEGKLAQAAAHYERALALKPDNPKVHNNLGNALKAQGKFEEAIAQYKRAIAIKPGYVEAFNNLGNLLREKGKLHDALVCYQQVLAVDPTNGIATHYVASIRGNYPESASHAYVTTLFDQFADTFDRQLIEKLEYEAPNILVGLIKDLCISTTDKWDVLDLGCGTGLVGAAIYPYAGQLIGVDLSAKMLAKASEKNLYQRLENSNLLSMMKDELNSSYDVIVAADVFIYIGKLDEIIQEGARLLRPGGVFAFSVEAKEALSNGVSTADDREYILNPTGRYAHSSIYIHELARKHGFTISSLTYNKIRFETGKLVDGHYAIFKRLP